MSSGLIAGLVIGGIVLIVAIYVICVYNKLVRLRTSVQEGFSTMDVYMKQRYDLIPNLVETVKGYMKHEKDTLSKIVELRNSCATTTDTQERKQKEGELTGALRQLFALAEAYPDLKANTNFLQLQGDLKAVEEKIANARKYYNAVVKDYTNLTQVFPSNIVAKMFKFEKFEMFVVDDAEERKNVKVQF